jgi:hypothetical protein
MDAHARKLVHEVAHRLKLKSKSTGSKDQRRPTLHRTKQTLAFEETSFNLAVAHLYRKSFGRPDTKVKNRAKTVGPGRVNHAAVTVQEGEIVGGSAREIDQNNRGRAMLERLGWTSGTALGALNNKGIMQPIEHVVKRSKAGLG